MESSRAPDLCARKSEGLRVWSEQGSLTALPVLTAKLETFLIQFAAIKVTEANEQKSYLKADPGREIGIACAFSSYNFKMMKRKIVPTVGKRSM